MDNEEYDFAQILKDQAAYLTKQETDGTKWDDPALI